MTRRETIEDNLLKKYYLSRNDIGVYKEKRNTK